MSKLSAPGTEVEIQELMLRHISGVALSADELLRLTATLKNDARLRETFAHLALQESLLRERGRARAAGKALATPDRAKLIPLWLWLWLGIGAVGVAGMVLVSRPVTEPEPVTVAKIRVGIVTAASDLVLGPGSMPAAPGDVLGPGSLVVTRGHLQIDFFSGARVLVPAGTQIDLISAWRASVKHGQVAARGHAGAIGFSLDAPSAKIFDLGTEFAVRAEGKGSAVRVFSGQVEASLLGENGSTRANALIKQDNMATLDPAASDVATTGAVAPETFVRVRALALPTLQLGATYVAQIQASRPLAYFRFEDDANDRFVSQGTQAVVLRARGGVARVGTTNRSLELVDDEQDRFLQSEGVVGDLPVSSYAIELWICAASMRHMALVSLVTSVPPAQPGQPYDHLSLVELRALENSLSHPAGAVRALHRFPAGPNGGANVFSQMPYRPGQWHHIVAVRQAQKLSLFVDGTKVATLPQPQETGTLPLHMVVAHLPKHKAGDSRPFFGRLDELAIYDRALSDAEVAAHFAAGRAPTSEETR